MKIAILLPGHLRSYNRARDNIFEKLIIPLQDVGHTCDIFSSIWSNSGHREVGWGGGIDSTNIKNDSVMFEVENDKRKEFISTFNNDKWRSYSHLSGPETCGDAVSMWYKIWKCFNLADKTYDIVFRIRTDIIFEDIFNVGLLDNIKSNTVYMSPWHGKYEVVTHKIMDHFSFGNYESMKIYCSVFPNIESILQRDDCAFTAEGFLYSQLQHNNITIIRVPIKYGVMRTHGVEKVS